jgi:secretion/DNA translocation related TadE-like protein
MKSARAGGESGAGSVLALAIVAALVCFTAMALPLYLVLAKKQSLAGAADAAALAAADVRAGLLPGEPCAVGAVVARANAAELGGCKFDGLVVTVTVMATVGGLPLRVQATAGPPPGAAHEEGR